MEYTFCRQDVQYIGRNILIITVFFNFIKLRHQVLKGNYGKCLMTGKVLSVILAIILMKN